MMGHYTIRANVNRPTNPLYLAVTHCNNGLKDCCQLVLQRPPTISLKGRITLHFQFLVKVKKSYCAEELLHFQLGGWLLC